jgi:hypothetical protein
MKSLLLLTTLFLALASQLHAAPILIQYQAEVRTSTGFLGLTFPFQTPVTGYFLFDTAVGDSNVSDLSRGFYEHAGNGGFSANLTGFNGGNPVPLAILGSGSPRVTVEWFPSSNDTWRYSDGLPNYGALTVNGVTNPDVDLGFAMTQPVFFASDANTNPWPLATFPGTNHTFALSDPNGQILLRINSFTAIPEPAMWAIALPAILGCWLARRRLVRGC